MSDILIAQEVGTVVVIETTPAEIVEVVAQGPQGPVGDVNPQMLVIQAAAEAARDSAVIAATAATSASTAAATSATNAAGSAATATTKATQAGTSATNAASSATAAASSASTASTQASNASTNATNAGNSATLANNWATKTTSEVVVGQGYGAKKYANDASASATSAASSATTATAKATAASTSETNAASSANTASTQATASTNSATNAAASATSAGTSATNAANSATTASAKAAEASVSANAALTSKNAASASATEAANSATAAAASQTSAADSATAAAASATNAANSLNLKLDKTGGNISANTSTAALTITQTGTGNAFVVEDSTSPDTSPFVIDADGRVIVGSSTSVSYGSEIGSARAQYNYTVGNGVVVSRWSANQPGQNLYLAKSRGAEVGTRAQVALNDILGTFGFVGDDGTSFVAGAKIASEVDSAPAVGSMPGRLVFSTTPNGSSSPVESLRIDSKQNIGKGGISPIRAEVEIRGNKVVTDGGTGYTGFANAASITDATVTGARGFATYINPGSNVTLGSLVHYDAGQRTFVGTATTQVGFSASSSLVGATNNYGFYGAIPAGTGRYNFYAAGTAANYFAGETSFGSNVTIAGNLTVTDPVVQQSDIGSAPNKIPLNLHLGQLAYADTAMVSVPASATANGLPGQIATDQDYLYVCVAVNTWKRTALTTW